MIMFAVIILVLVLVATLKDENNFSFIASVILLKKCELTSYNQLAT